MIPHLKCGTEKLPAEKASCGNDGVWKAWKAMKPLSTLPTPLGNPFGIPTFPQLWLLPCISQDKQLQRQRQTRLTQTGELMDTKYKNHF